MSLLNNKLSALLPGSQVRFVHVSGRIIDGIIAENDGSESLSVQITSLATLRYDQISMIEESQQAEVITPVLTADSSKKKIQPLSNVTKITCDKGIVSQALKAMKTEEKDALNQAVNKFQSFLISHEMPKCEEAIRKAENIIIEISKKSPCPATWA